MTKNSQCQYIGAEQQGPGYRMLCTCPTVKGRSYCAEHLALVYQAGTARARRKKDIRVANSVWDIESEFNAAVEELIEEGYDPAEPRWEVVED